MDRSTARKWPQNHFRSDLHESACSCMQQDAQAGLQPPPRLISVGFALKLIQADGNNRRLWSFRLWRLRSRFDLGCCRLGPGCRARTALVVCLECDSGKNRGDNRELHPLRRLRATCVGSLSNMRNLDRLRSAGVDVAGCGCHGLNHHVDISRTARLWCKRLHLKPRHPTLESHRRWSLGDETPSFLLRTKDNPRLSWLPPTHHAQIQGRHANSFLTEALQNWPRDSV
mmetsp:Transcript_25763/g.51654  ORF Transcript_25763/g.51654 Transcript_25763/m.51654 type:complete len:228 (+) Transcript_25763:58-741(+)